MMRTLRSVLLVVSSLALAGGAGADTIQLKSGYRIFGKVSDSRSNGGSLVVDIDGIGSLILAREQVTAVVKDDRRGVPASAPEGQAQPALAAQPNLVAVRLKKGHGFYGSGPLYGVRSAQSNDTTLVLEMPGMGEMRIPQAAVEEVTPVAPLGSAQPVPAVAPPGVASRTIRTSHVVSLKNKTRILGNLVATPPSAPVTLEVGAIGRLTIPRARIEKIEALAGEIQLPEPEPEPEPGPSALGPPEGRTPDTPAAPAGGPPRKTAQSTERRAEIEGYVYELTRWRSQNRTRAERALVSIGAEAIPFLGEVARDPFELARRAVQRIVRDIGDPAGIPLAIEGLLDDDDHVRETAAEALRTIAKLDHGYRPYASPERRLEAYRRWKSWWAEQATAQ